MVSSLFFLNVILFFIFIQMTSAQWPSFTTNTTPRRAARNVILCIFVLLAFLISLPEPASVTLPWSEHFEGAFCVIEELSCGCLIIRGLLLAAVWKGQVWGWNGTRLEWTTCPWCVAQTQDKLSDLHRSMSVVLCELISPHHKTASLKA